MSIMGCGEVLGFLFIFVEVIGIIIVFIEDFDTILIARAGGLSGLSDS